MFDSLSGLVGLIALFGLIVVVARQNGRLALLERETRALRSLVLSPLAQGGAAGAAEPAPPRPSSVPTVPGPALVPDSDAPLAAQGADPTQTDPPAAGAAQPDVPSSDLKPDAPSPSGGRPDIETALGTRWAVWVGGLALALGGLFLVRYSIEAGIFGPAARIVLAALLGVALVGTGEFIRRTGYRMPVDGAANAYIPAILTAAGVFTLFGAVYAAHAVYGFIGPAFAFALLGVIGIGSIVLALLHGQALAGIGLLGALASPLLVAAQAPNHWALFVYLAVVMATATAVARLRAWRFLVSAAMTGTGLWCLLYMVDVEPANLWIVLFINFAALGCLALLWCGDLIPTLGRSADDAFHPFPAAAPAFFACVAALALLVVPHLRDPGGPAFGAVLVVGMIAVAMWRSDALPLLFGAGLAVVLAFLRIAFAGSFAVDMMGETLTVDGLGGVIPAGSLPIIGAVLGVAFLAAGIWRGRALAALHPTFSACWTAFAGMVPVVVTFCVWFAYGNPDRDLVMAAVALVLALALAVGGEFVARAEEPPLSGGMAVTAMLVAAAAAWILMLHMAFGSALTTILVGASAVIPAYATRFRSYRALGGLSVAASVVTLLRVAGDPTIVGAEFLSVTPVFNVLLPGYGVPAIAFGFSAWQLARTTAGRPRLAMEAAAALFSLLTVAMLVRHAMNGGVIYGDAPTLGEQAIYSLIALGAGAILIALDMRSPSSVLRYGSIAAGILSVTAIVLQHFLVLNPLFTEESTGKFPLFNLLFLAYLLPAMAAGALALYARTRRPRWYAMMLGLTAALLVFAYATLSVRRLFKGEFIGLWSGLGQVETYSYSALWLLMGVALLVVGVRATSTVLRVASGALIAVAVAKVFLFDMSELEGVLRALSFIGLGAVLIGIGLFYQKLLTRAAR